MIFLIDAPVLARWTLNARKCLRRSFHRLWPRASLGQLQSILDRYLDFHDGYFVEAGANDGFSQSNSLFLARRRGWRGILIEPIPELASIARRWRSDAIVENICLVAPENTGQMMTMLDLDLQSVILSDNATEEQLGSHAVPSDVRRAQRLVKISAETLSGVLSRHGNPIVDFLSIDVEGYELEVMRGLNLQIHAPRFILIETHTVGEVTRLLGNLYILRERCSPHDYLFERIHSATELSIDGSLE